MVLNADNQPTVHHIIWKEWRTLKAQDANILIVKNSPITDLNMEKQLTVNRIIWMEWRMLKAQGVNILAAKLHNLNLETTSPVVRFVQNMQIERNTGS